MDQKYCTPNELNLVVKGVNNQELINEKCCTSINIILTNEGNIMTSFLGAHNPEIISQLEHAMKVYFKSIKKTLKAKYLAKEIAPEEKAEDKEAEGEKKPQNKENKPSKKETSSDKTSKNTKKTSVKK